MRLAEGFITHQTPDDQVMIAVGKAAESFHGLARSNKTAAFIIDCLKEETTPARIADAMCARYDAPRERIETDIEGILAQLRSIGALEE